MTSEATHSLVTLTNEVRVGEGRARVVLNECIGRWSGGRGWVLYMRPGKGEDFPKGPCRICSA